MCRIVIKYNIHQSPYLHITFDVYSPRTTSIVTRRPLDSEKEESVLSILKGEKICLKLCWKNTMIFIKQNVPRLPFDILILDSGGAWINYQFFNDKKMNLITTLVFIMCRIYIFTRMYLLTLCNYSYQSTACQHEDLNSNFLKELRWMRRCSELLPDRMSSNFNFVVVIARLKTLKQRK